MSEPQCHADHGPEVTCRPAGNGLCEPASEPGEIQPGREPTAAEVEEFRQKWREAVADLHRHQRQHRTSRRPQEITGYVKPPEQLPLDTP